MYLLTLYRQLSDSLRADLVTLGLERRQKEIDLVGEIANLHRQAEAERRRAPDAPEPPTEPTGPPRE